MAPMAPWLSGGCQVLGLLVGNPPPPPGTIVISLQGVNTKATLAGNVAGRSVRFSSVSREGGSPTSSSLVDDLDSLEEIRSRVCIRAAEASTRPCLWLFPLGSPRFILASGDTWCLSAPALFSPSPATPQQLLMKSCLLVGCVALGSVISQ